MENRDIDPQFFLAFLDSSSRIFSLIIVEVITTTKRSRVEGEEKLIMVEENRDMTM